MEQEPDDTEAQIQENAKMAKPELLYADPNTGGTSTEPVDKTFKSVVGGETLGVVSQTEKSEDDQTDETKTS